jgi:hypothetical protein
LNVLKAKVQDRDNLLLDYDKFRNKVQKYTEKPPKDPAKATTVINTPLSFRIYLRGDVFFQAQQRLESCKELYTSTNEGLKKELRETYETRYQRFERAYNAVRSLSFLFFFF